VAGLQRLLLWRVLVEARCVPLRRSDPTSCEHVGNTTRRDDAPTDSASPPMVTASSSPRRRGRTACPRLALLRRTRDGVDDSLSVRRPPVVTSRSSAPSTSRTAARPGKQLASWPLPGLSMCSGELRQSASKRRDLACSRSARLPKRSAPFPRAAGSRASRSPSPPGGQSAERLRRRPTAVPAASPSCQGCPPPRTRRRDSSRGGRSRVGDLDPRADCPDARPHGHGPAPCSSAFDTRFANACAPPTAPIRPTQQRAGARGGGPGLLLCQEAGASPALVFVVRYVGRR
jgi:hypothetical protein